MGRRCSVATRRGRDGANRRHLVVDAASVRPLLHALIFDHIAAMDPNPNAGLVLVSRSRADNADWFREALQTLGPQPAFDRGRNGGAVAGAARRG
jgi:hypothetical protein